MTVDVKSKKAYLHSTRALSVVFFVFTLYLCMLYHNTRVFTVRPLYTTVILAVAVISAIWSIASSFTKKVNVFPIVMLIINIGCLGSFQQTNISLAYVIPIFLAYYSQNRKATYHLLRFDIIVFFISRLLKAYLIYITSGRSYGAMSLIAGQAIVAALEAIVFLSVVIPVFKFLLDKNEALKQALKEKEEATDDILQFCSTITSYHNKYLTAHIKGVREITKVLMDTLIDEGILIEKDYYDQILFSVQFHDIGKIYIDPAILDKNGKLTSEEMSLVKEHPERGEKLIELLPKNVAGHGYIEVCKNVILQHHEKLDGTGYPYGLSGCEISFEARLIAVADVADALLSWRPYKAPMTWDKLESIFNMSKGCYESVILEALFKNKDKVLEISNANNILLKNILSLNESELARA